jgi:hypothetical protein
MTQLTKIYSHNLNPGTMISKDKMELDQAILSYDIDDLIKTVKNISIKYGNNPSTIENSNNNSLVYIDSINRINNYKKHFSLIKETILDIKNIINTANSDYNINNHEFNENKENTNIINNINLNLNLNINKEDINIPKTISSKKSAIELKIMKKSSKKLYTDLNFDLSSTFENTGINLPYSLIKEVNKPSDSTMLDEDGYINYSDAECYGNIIEYKAESPLIKRLRASVDESDIFYRKMELKSKKFIQVPNSCPNREKM